MNFKIIIILMFLIGACGVKNYPAVPEGTQIPSYPAKFLKKTATDTEDQKQK